MKFRISITALLALALLSASVANTPSKAAESHDHGAHGAVSPSTINASIAPTGGSKVGEPTTFTLSLVANDGKPVTLADLQVAHTERSICSSSIRA